MDPDEAAEAIAKGLEKVLRYACAIEPDPGFENKVAKGIRYEYGRAILRPVFYSFGTPLSRQVGVSLAVRMSKNPNVIIFGTRDPFDFDMQRIREMKDMPPADKIEGETYLTGRPTSLESRYEFDLGPSMEWATLMKKNIDLEAIYVEKPGKTFAKDGVGAYYVKNAPVHGDFGHYRGTFKKPRVLILADPDGADDLLTSKALTGARGQYLQGLMRDIGVEKDYLVIKTLPFDMDGADEADYRKALELTNAHRQELLTKLLAENEFDMILTDGRYAAEEMDRLLGVSEMRPENYFNIGRVGRGNNSGIVEVGRKIAKTEKFKGFKASGVRANIPRSHLTFYAHTWEGTAGDRVITGKDTEFFVKSRKTGKSQRQIKRGEGVAYAIVAPEWAYKEKPPLDEHAARLTKELINRMALANLPMPGEHASEYFSRQGEAVARSITTPKSQSEVCMSRLSGYEKREKTKLEKVSGKPRKRMNESKRFVNRRAG